MLSQEQVKGLVREAFEMCRQQMPVKSCWLYGSYARGDFDDESDVDILMSVSVPEEELRKYRHAVADINSKLSLKYDITVSITVKTEENFVKYSRFVPYYKNVLREGQLYAG